MRVIEYNVSVKLFLKCVGSCVSVLCGEPDRVVSVEIPQDIGVSCSVEVVKRR